MVGDLVKIDNEASRQHGRTGRVVEIDGFEILVELKGLGRLVFLPFELELVEQLSLGGIND